MSKTKSNSNNVSIPKPNYSCIPNVIFDYWVPHLAKTSKSDVIVLLIISRQTIGWHKDRDCLSISQLMNKTGLSKQTIVDSLKRLIHHGLIKKLTNKSKKGDCDSNTYVLKIEEEKEENGSQSNRQGVVKPLDKGSLMIRQRVVKPLDTQKKPITKETYTKETTTPISPIVDNSTVPRASGGGRFLSKDQIEEVKSCLAYSESNRLPFCEQEISRWITEFSGSKVIEKLSIFRDKKQKFDQGKSNKPIRDPNSWMASALKKDYI